MMEFVELNDIHREKLCFTRFSTRMATWLLLTFLIYNQLSPITSRIKSRCLKNMIHQIGSKTEWLLLSASFTAKLKALRLKTHHFHIKLPYQKPMLRQIEW